MSSRTAFAKTWWGKKWIEALENIDINENRLPRGRSYARNENVRDIHFAENQILAKVKGRRPSPYSIKISLSKYNKTRTDKVLEIIRENPAIASELSLGRLPEDLYNLLRHNKINLLPGSWDDFKSGCSCPDWANPCKHIAAVYYLLGREIDKNPFILFNLRGIPTDQLTGLAEIRSKQDRKLYSLKKAFLPRTKIEVSKTDDEYTAPLNFPDYNIDELLAILPGQPFFYHSGDFKKILQEAYKHSAGFVSGLEIDEEAPKALKRADFTLVFSGSDVSCPHVFISDKELIRAVRPKFRTKLEKGAAPVVIGEKIQIAEKDGAYFSLNEIIAFFASLPVFTYTRQISESGRFLSVITVMALAIVQSHSFLPQIIWKDEEEFAIRYVPHFHNEKLSQAFGKLEGIFPQAIAFDKSNGRIMSLSGLQDILSQFITAAFHFSLMDDESYADDKIKSVFFSDDVTYVAERFDEKNTGKAIADWLERFSALREDIIPVIEILDKNKDSFSLQIFAENKRDPLSVPVPLSEIFGDEKKIFNQPAAFVRNGFSRQVAVAGEYLPELKSVLNARGLEPAMIDMKRIAEILTQHAGFLEFLGIRFILPKALKNLLKPAISLVADSKKSKTVSYLNLDSMLEFSWRVSIGDQELSEKEFRELLSLSEGIVKFKDQYVLLDPEETKRLIEKLNNPPADASSMEILRSALTGEWDGVPFISGERLKELLDNLGKTEEVDLPGGIDAELRPYQFRGYQWMYSNLKKGFGCCIADDMGLGKTLQVITALKKLKDDGAMKGAALIVCPTTLVGNWFKEFEKFAPLFNVLIYHGTEKTLDIEDKDIVVTTYGLVRRYTEEFADIEWDALVIDEAQNIKNPATDQTRSLKAIKAKYRIAMSGTPVENRLTELWSIFDFLNRGYMGGLSDFRTKYALPIERYRDEAAVKKLRLCTSPFLIRRLKSDRSIITDLPDKLVSDDFCTLTKEQAVLYEQIVNRTMEKIESADGIERKGLIFQLMTHLKQICNHPVHFSGRGNPLPEHSGKSERIMDILEKIIERGEKALIFTQYKTMGDLLGNMILENLGTKAHFFHGGLTRKQRDRFVKEFQTEYDPRIMIISLKAGGTGLNLTNAANVIHYDLWWNPAVEDQATDRAYRIGQTRNVQVHRLITMGTFEEKIDAMIRKKKELANLTVSAGETWITEMSNEDLKDIFSLQNRQ